MSDLAIRVENLTKKFYLGERVGIKTFREALQDLVTAPFRVWKRNGNGDGQEKLDTEREIWALKGVSFEVKHGEVLGIIGPNGAGKSTLLKILSRITEPTGGYAEIRGRVGSLLEVGTGFHPELTGRENVYLNGSILGMSKSEIRRKFDDIVSFAGVEKFIDTPVKRYSSGMQVRLAFAVAAHLDPEILIIDEVLAVGDAEFQKRCLGKMDEVSRSGRTVLFVSHNMAAVESLCEKAILLNSGIIGAQGATDCVISKYATEAATSLSGDVDLWLARGRPPYAKSVFRRLRILNKDLKEVSAINVGEPILFEITLEYPEQIGQFVVGIHVYNSRQVRLLTLHTAHQINDVLRMQRKAVLNCFLPHCRLMPDRYSVILGLQADRGIVDRIESGIYFDVLPSDYFGTGRLPRPGDGLFLEKAIWKLITY